MNPAVSYLSMFRNVRANAAPVDKKAVGGPVGASTSATALDQARALRQPYAPAQAMASPNAPPPAFAALGREDQAALTNAYGAGGFEGVAKLPGWYDLPPHVRTALLAGSGGF